MRVLSHYIVQTLRRRLVCWFFHSLIAVCLLALNERLCGDIQSSLIYIKWLITIKSNKKSKSRVNELQTVTKSWNIVLGREAPRKWSEFHFKHNILKINSESSIYFDVCDVLFSMECNLFFQIPETYLGAYWSGLQTKYVHIDSIQNASNTFQWDLHRLCDFLIHQVTVGSHIKNQTIKGTFSYYVKHITSQGRRGFTKF